MAAVLSHFLPRDIVIHMKKRTGMSRNRFYKNIRNYKNRLLKARDKSKPEWKERPIGGSKISEQQQPTRWPRDSGPVKSCGNNHPQPMTPPPPLPPFTLQPDGTWLLSAMSLLPTWPVHWGQGWSSSCLSRLYVILILKQTALAHFSNNCQGLVAG